MRGPATKSESALTTASSPFPGSSRFPVWLVAALLVLVTTAVYWPATRGDFIDYDDGDYVTDNAHVTSGLTLENARWAFQNSYACNWHPLTWLSHMADCQLFGLNPWGHHLTSVLLHAVNTGLVFLLLRRLTDAFWRSALVAALFGLHPLHVESVAWVAERKDVLSTFFFLLTLLAYAEYAERLRAKGSRLKEGKQPGKFSAFSLQPLAFYGLALLCFALGLMSKPMLVTLPFVLLLLDFWPLGRVASGESKVQSPESEGGSSPLGLQGSKFEGQGSTVCPPPCSRLHPLSSWRRLAVEKWPFFALAAVASVATFLVQRHGGTVTTIQKLPLDARIGNALVSYGRYLGKLFWPAHLAVFYPHPGYWPRKEVIVAVALLLGLSGLLYVKRRQYPFLLMGWLWFCGTLVPVIGLVQVGSSAMADRYAYIPSLGVLILAVWGACELATGWRYGVSALPATGSVVVALCLGSTEQQIGYWKDSETLFRQALAATGKNPMAHNCLGGALERKGQIDRAIEQYREALRLKADDADAHNNLGAALGKQGQIDESIRQFQEALRLKPNRAEAHYNLGIALGVQGQTDEAIREFQEALRLRPDYPKAHNKLGIALLKQGQTDEAVRHFQEAVHFKPDDPEANENLRNALGATRQTDQAIRQLQEALRLRPNDAEARAELGAALLKKGHTDEASRQFQEAVRLQPDNAKAHDNLGVALLHKGQTDEAILQFHEALRLQPDNATAHNNLGTALGLKGQSDEAVAQFEEALRLKPDYAEAGNNLGYKWAERGENLEQARALIEQALRLEPTNPSYLDSLGWVLFKLNRPSEGLAYLLKAVESSARPGAGLYDHLGDVYAALNQREQAAEAWRKSLSLRPSRQVEKKLGDSSAR